MIELPYVTNLLTFGPFDMTSNRIDSKSVIIMVAKLNVPDDTFGANETSEEEQVLGGKNRCSFMV